MAAENSTNWSTSTGGQKFPDGRHVLRLGDSFFTKSAPSYHTMRYDFKPASVGDCKETYVEVAENQEVTVTVPKLDETGEVRDATMFKGPRKPYQKECLLIYNHETGEFVLEQLTYNIQLKKTRGEVTEEVLQNIRDTRKKLAHSAGSDTNGTAASIGGSPTSVIGRTNNNVVHNNNIVKNDAVMNDAEMMSESDDSHSESDSSDEGGGSGEMHSDMEANADDAEHYSEDELAKSLEAELSSAQRVKEEPPLPPPSFANPNVASKHPNIASQAPNRQSTAPSSALHEDLALSESSDED